MYCNSIVALLSVVAYISQTFQNSEPNSEIVIDKFKGSSVLRYLGDATKVLSVTASSISTGLPLPPEMNIRVEKEEELIGSGPGGKFVHLHTFVNSDVEALNVIELATAQCTRAVEKIHQEVKILVGEMVF
jgi:hypothetical protein